MYVWSTGPFIYVRNPARNRLRRRRQKLSQAFSRHVMSGKLVEIESNYGLLTYGIKTPQA